MAVLKEFICMAHGAFESSEEKCPHGCKGTMVSREFRTAPNTFMVSKNMDSSLRNLSNDYNMNDIKQNTNGSYMGGQQQQPDLAPRWSSGGLGGLQSQGHDLGHSGLKAVSGMLQKPESKISSAIKASSAKELK